MESDFIVAVSFPFFSFTVTMALLLPLVRVVAKLHTIETTVNPLVLEKEDAEDLFSEALDMDYARTADGVTRLAKFYAAEGKVQELLDCYDKAPLKEADTVNRNYITRLDRIAESYHNAGDEVKSLEYASRADALQKMISSRDSLSAGLKISEYKNIDYRIRLDDAIDYGHKWWKLLSIAGLVLFAAFIIILEMLLKKRRTRKHLKELLGENDSLRKEVELLRARTTGSFSGDGQNTETVSPLVKLIEDDKLYLDKNLSRDAVIELLGCSQRKFSAMLSEIEPGLSFPVYINRLRIGHAISMMESDSETPLSEIAEQCGYYSVRTFQRAFLSIKGMSPSDFRNNGGN